MKMANPKPLCCAIYTRKSTEEGLDQEFNSLDAQREAAEAFIQSLSVSNIRCTGVAAWTAEKVARKRAAAANRIAFSR